MLKPVHKTMIIPNTLLYYIRSLVISDRLDPSNVWLPTAPEYNHTSHPAVEWDVKTSLMTGLHLFLRNDHRFCQVMMTQAAVNYPNTA
jgi:hypothetical protein